MPDTSYIYGRNTVVEALRSEANIEKIFICYGAQGDILARIYSLAKQAKVQAVTYDRQKFIALEKQICGQDGKSQGVIALLTTVEAISLQELVGITNAIAEIPLLIVLDEISDPHNLGAIARSAECAGAHGIIISARNSSPLTPTAIKISAGALEHISVAKVSSVSQTLEYLKNNGYWIVGTDMDAEHVYTEKNIWDRPLAIVIGSEGSGMRPSIAKQCDILVKIPMLGKISSLNASVSAGVILFEALRQRIELNKDYKIEKE